MSSSLRGVATKFGSFCNPSRGPTSTIRTKFEGVICVVPAVVIDLCSLGDLCMYMSGEGYCCRGMAQLIRLHHCGGIQFGKRTKARLLMHMANKNSSQSRDKAHIRKVLPSHAYKGKQERIRKEVAQKNKLEREYARILKQEEANLVKPSYLEKESGELEVPQKKPVDEVKSHSEQEVPLPTRHESFKSVQDRIEAKKLQRSQVTRREQSKTKQGQPKIKDRMKNILDKLQLEQT